MSSASSSTSCSSLICSLCLLSRASHGGGELAKVGLCVVYLVPSSLAKIKKEAARGENEGTTNRTRVWKNLYQKKFWSKNFLVRNFFGQNFFLSEFLFEVIFHSSIGGLLHLKQFYSSVWPYKLNSKIWARSELWLLRYFRGKSDWWFNIWGLLPILHWTSSSSEIRL